MLVKMIDIKGKEVWLNPVYVKAVSANTRKGYTEVYCSSFGSFGTSTIKVNAPADEVAAALSEAMPGAVPYAVLMGEEEEQRKRQQAAAAAAAG
mgnify:FL=1